MPPSRSPGGHAPRFGARVGKDGHPLCRLVGRGRAGLAGAVRCRAARKRPRGWKWRARRTAHSALTVPGLKAGTRYGFRADGPYAPERGLWFDPEKLLVDPYAVEIDRPFAYSPELSRRRGEGGDTAALGAEGNRMGCARTRVDGHVQYSSPAASSTSYRCAPSPCATPTSRRRSGERSLRWPIRRRSGISRNSAFRPSS